MSKPIAMLDTELDSYRSGTGQWLKVHQRKDCTPPCPIHDPSEHPMRDFKLHYREDRGIFERLCPHGVGHPDPDTLAYIATKLGDEEAEAQGIHGCDGCCMDPEQRVEVFGSESPR
jgi:hypothetical protein